MGLALNMYVADYRFYPFYNNNYNDNPFWYDRLWIYYPPGTWFSPGLRTTNFACPAYKGRLDYGFESGSYAYNSMGTAWGIDLTTYTDVQNLGLGGSYCPGNLKQPASTHLWRTLMGAEGRRIKRAALAANLGSPLRHC